MKRTTNQTNHGSRRPRYPVNDWMIAFRYIKLRRHDDDDDDDESWIIRLFGVVWIVTWVQISETLEPLTWADSNVLLLLGLLLLY